MSATGTATLVLGALALLAHGPTPSAQPFPSRPITHGDGVRASSLRRCVELIRDAAQPGARIAWESRAR
jgi:hypothetical protein